MKQLLTSLACLLLLVSSPLPAATVAPRTFWVAPDGDDGNPGTDKTKPLATLARAAEFVRRARADQPQAPVTVHLAAGDHPQTDPLILTAAHSGTSEAPVVWQGEGPEKTRILGARPLPLSSFKPVSDPVLLERMLPEARGKVMEWDFSTAGLRHAGPLPEYARESAALFTLYQDGKRLPLARWPNGEFGYTTMKRVVASGSWRASTSEGGIFEYREDRPARWQAALSEGGVWLRGFWRVPWVAETLKVKAINPQEKTITFAVSISQGIGSKYSKLTQEQRDKSGKITGGTRAGDGKEPWFVLNLLEEIDQPGEWAVDFHRSKLYLMPPQGGGPILLADNADPLLSFQGASHIILRDLTAGFQMGDGIQITDGTSIRLLGCRITAVQGTGVMIRGGTGHEVRSCDLHEIGLAAVDLLGGDRATLTPSGHQITNNHVYRSALAAPVPALIAGLDAKRQNLVGARIAHNRVHDVTYSGIHFAGNDNILEYNEFYRLGLDGGDLGGFYTTGGWTARGNVVRHNFIHHAENANAVYMDDGQSGLLVEDNLIFRAESGIFIGGGHDHLVRRNVIVQCPRGFHMDARGTEAVRNYVPTDPRLRGDLDSVPYKESPWKERYPALVGILDHDTRVPRGNVIRDNFAVACETHVRRSGKPANLGGFEFTNNVEIASVDVFTDAPSLNFKLREPAHAGLSALEWMKDFKLSRYGLQVDEFRGTLPERDIELLKTGDTKRRKFDSQQDVESYQQK